MLPAVLVLLVATSALAAPSINIVPRNINSIPPQRDNGRIVSGAVIERALDNTDGGDTNVYTLLLNNAINNLSNQADSASQSLALGQLIAVLSKLSTGVPGDACASANFINSYVNAVRTGNSAGVRAALQNYVSVLLQSIDQIVQLVVNPGAAKYAVGPQGSCYANGRSYQFEAAWDAILDNAVNPDIVNDQYCAAKRLYDGFNVQTNNIAASVTAMSLPPVNQLFQRALTPLANFVRALGSNSSPAGAAAAAKAALISAASSY